MKTKLAQTIGILLLGVASTGVYAATDTTTKPKAPAPMVATTAFIYGGAMQTAGQCTVFNPSMTALTIVDVHAEDGQGNVLAAKNAEACDKALAGARACTVNFAIQASDAGAVCFVKIAPPAPKAKKADTTALPALPPPPPALGIELLDNAGNVLVYANSMLPPPPPPAPNNKGGQPQGGNGGQPPQGGNGGQPPQGGNGGQPPQGGNGGQPPQGGNGGQPPQGGNGGQLPQ